MRGETLTIAIVAGACLSAGAAAGPNPAHRRTIVAAGGTPEGPVTILISNNVAGDLHLSANPDAFGGVSDAYDTTAPIPVNNDLFDPAGPEPALKPSFASSLFVYAPATSDRIALGYAGSGWTGTFGAGNTLIATITSPLDGSDSDNDGVDDTADSAFTITGGTAALNLAVTLKQRVYKPAAGASRYRHTFTFTNNAAAAANLKIIKHNDLDIFTVANPTIWQEVGGSIDQNGCPGINPYEREPEPEPPTTPIAVALLPVTPGSAYYAGKSGFDPDGVGPDPAMAYGTDVQVWNAFGLPPSWENYTAGIGHSPITGELPQQQPPGSILPWDGFMGLQWTVSIPPGGVQKIDVIAFYGARTGYVCYPDANCDGALTVADFGAFQTQFVLGGLYADCNNSGTLTVADFGCFQTAFVSGCP